MKFTAKTTNNERLLFNDLGDLVKGVSPQARFVMLDPGASVILPEGEHVLYSAISGDAKKYSDAGLLVINDEAVVADDASITLTHNWGIVPNVTVSKIVAGAYVPVLAADVEISTNAAKTVTTVKNVSGGALTLYVRIN
jgi:hypothetical protein